MTIIEYEKRKDFVWPKKFLMVKVEDLEEAQTQASLYEGSDKYKSAFYIEGRGDYKASSNFLILVADD